MAITPETLRDAETLGGVDVSQLRTISGKSLTSTKSLNETVNKLAFLLPIFNPDNLSAREVIERLILQCRATILTGLSSFCVDALESLKKDPSLNTPENKELLGIACNIIDKKAGFDPRWFANWFKKYSSTIQSEKFLKEHNFQNYECLKRPQQVIKEPMLYPLEVVYYAARVAFNLKRPRPDAILNSRVKHPQQPLTTNWLTFDSVITLPESTSQTSSSKPRIKASFSSRQIKVIPSASNVKKFLRNKDTPYLLDFFKNFKSEAISPDSSQEAKLDRRLSKRYAFYSFDELATFELNSNFIQPDDCIEYFREQFVRFVPKKISIECLGDSQDSKNAEYAFEKLFEAIDLLCNISFLDNRKAYVKKAHKLLKIYEKAYLPKDETENKKLLFYKEEFLKARSMIERAKELHEGDYDEDWQSKIKALFKGNHYKSFCIFPLFFSAIDLYEATQRKSSSNKNETVQQPSTSNSSENSTESCTDMA